jgi:hypothetical protein
VILLVLAALSVVPLPPPPPLAAGAAPGGASVPAERAGWISQEVRIDRLFLGFVQFREVVSRRYERDGAVVYLFLGEASHRSAWSSPFSPKTILPGLRWVPLPLEADAPVELPHPPDQTALIARESERWWVAQWRFGDPGVLLESLRQLFALDASPWGDHRPRRVVRLAAPVDPAHGDDVTAAERAVVAFAEEFEDVLYLSAARDSR